MMPIAPPRPRRRRHDTDEPRITAGWGLFVAVVMCALALITVFGVIPARTADSARKEEEAARIVREKAAVQLLHNFDCTYGAAIRETLGEAARSQRVSAHVSLGARHNALLRHDRKAAHRALVSYRNASAAAKKYGSLAASLQPLAPGTGPCTQP